MTTQCSCRKIQSSVLKFKLLKLQENMRNLKRSLVPAVCKAVRGLHETRGSSLRSIATFIQASMRPGTVAPTHGDVRAALKIAEADQKLKLTNAGRYMLPSFLFAKRRRGGGGGGCGKRRSRSRGKRRSSHRRKSGHKKRKSLCKPRCQGKNKKKKGHRRRKCPKPCTRMWKPRRGGSRKGRKGRKGRKCDIENYKQNAVSIDPSQIKVENTQ